ncbi:hypothetical protein FC07_GL001857 [Loigolactobacillus bifermentans DSM 20003]|uniref:Peptide O-xylosyltransferase n=3 Tax=Loigolactobacillus bifermentans TaxID=1607 RepID=A0A0R1HAB2_9LACO|nr:hypothetical protein FC07_GL001857 [Loigolactobacillus bifermentans DSM 20003]
MINLLDSDSIDFYIHWDLKSAKPSFLSNYSKIHLVPRRKVYWGGQSLTFVTLDLIKFAIQGEYDFYHIVSGQDMCLMDKQHFETFFKNHYKSNFIDLHNTSEYLWRVKYFYFFEKLNIPRRLIYELALMNAKIQSFLRIDRLRNRGSLHIGKGEHWASINKDLAKKICNKSSFEKIKAIFKDTFISDEMWLQTVVLNPDYFFDNGSAIFNNAEKTRLIDWSRGNPYVFNEEDFKNLVNELNGEYAFIRKVEPSLAKKIALALK